MHRTVIDRRRALALLAASTALAARPRRAGACPAPDYLATGPDGAGFRLLAFDGAGDAVYSVPLPGRGHDIALRPGSADVAVVARRPGHYVAVFDRRDGTVGGTLEAPDGRLFYGHGVYSADGKLLYTTENAYDTGDGTVGVWDATDDYRRVGELPSHGIGPHDIALMPDGRTLAVANGGIRTHPDSGRTKLNLADMAPSLAYVDSRNGALRHAVRLAPSLHQLSIRHVDALGDRVVFAMQWEGDPADAPPLLGVQQGGGKAVLLEAPEIVQRRFKNYVGDVCLSRSGETVAISAQRGDTLGFWSVADGRWLTAVTLADGCALTVASTADGFMAASGVSGVIHVEPRTGVVRRLASAVLDGGVWDNHMVALDDALAAHRKGAVAAPSQGL
jgi:hypothetical protein